MPEMNKVQEIPMKKRGGARPGSGRKKGTTNKYSAGTILEEIANADVPFEIGLARDYAAARLGDDKHLVQKYQAMIMNKVIPDKSHVDVTSDGAAMLLPNFIFTQAELPS